MVLAVWCQDEDAWIVIISQKEVMFHLCLFVYLSASWFPGDLSPAQRLSV